VAEQGARDKPAGTRIAGATKDVQINGMATAIKTIQAFAREIAQMSMQADVRANQHIEKLRKGIAWNRLRRSRRIF
jgi:hypothetical protein